MSFMSDYEKQRAKNIAENKRILAGLGFDKPFSPFPSIPKKKTSSKQVKRKRTEVQKPRKELAVSSQDQSSDEGRPLRRRSGRLLGKEPGDFQGLDFEIDEEDEKPKKVQRNRENVFGPIPGVEVGTTWETRVLCSAAGVHRPTVAGIHGNSEGCYSIALSGGYEDDLDYGECFTYTGEGGRDLKGTKANPKNLRTAPQSKDQTLSRGNFSLVKSVEKELPVRVIRGYKLDSPFAPEEGYRYDGLYNVEKYWKAVGMSGYVVYKFALKRCESQGPPIWQLEDTIEDSNLEESKEETNENTTRNSPNEKNCENTDTVEDNSHKTDKNQVRFEINGEKQNGSSSEDEKTQNGEFTDATEEKDLESIHSKSDNRVKEVETSKEERREEKENDNKEDDDTSKTDEINEAKESDKGE